MHRQKDPKSMHRQGHWKQQALLIGGDILVLLGTFYLLEAYWWQGPNVRFFPASYFLLGSYLIALTMFDLYDIHMNYHDHEGSTLAHLLGAILTANLVLSG